MIVIVSLGLSLVAPLLVLVGTVFQLSFDAVCSLVASGLLVTALFVTVLQRFTKFVKREMPLVASVCSGFVAATLLAFAGEISRLGTGGLIAGCFLVLVVTVIAGYLQMAATTEARGDLVFAKAGVLSMAQIACTSAIYRELMWQTEFFTKIFFAACAFLVICAFAWVSEAARPIR